MDLFAAMLAKGLIGVAWAAWAEWRDSRKSVLDEQGGCYHASQPLLRLPPPEKPTDTP